MAVHGDPEISATGLSATWWDPPAGAGAHDVDWVAWAQALPFCRDLGLVCRELSLDSAVFTMAASTLTANPNGAVNGGIVVAAADQVMGAITRRQSVDGLPATGSLHIQFHLPAMAPLVFRAVTLGGGRRTKFVEVVVEDAAGNRCATSQGTMIVGGSARGVAPG